MTLFSIILIFFSVHIPSYSQNQAIREVVLFYPKDKLDIASKQLKILSSDLAGLSERQIKTTRVVTNTKDYEKYSSFKVNPNLFTIVLIGKDGGQKFTSNTIITSAKLYSLIDQMPMRKQEMKN